VWGTLEPFSRTYLTLALPGADPAWSAGLHAPILEALRRRDPDAVVASLDRHFEQVRDDMARRLPADEPPADQASEVVSLRRRRRDPAR